MAAEALILSDLIQTNIDSNFEAIIGTSPLSQANPSFFIEMTTAIGTGIADGSLAISFTTEDEGLSGSPPVPGTGSGVGIFIDEVAFSQNLYTEIRSSIISTFGSTTHEVFPPSSNNTSGLYLKALTDGLALAVKSHFETAWTLTSSHPTIYQGVGEITEGSFSGLDSTLITSEILANSPSLQGSFWPTIAEKIALAYVDTIHNHSVGTVTIAGSCSSGSGQACGIPSTGTGSGVAS